MKAMRRFQTARERSRRQPRQLQKEARAQGVERPFKILVAMPERLRRHMAALLGIRLQRRLETPEAQAWVIISASMRGIQARSHGPREQLVPLARKHNWWEIIMAAARHLKLSVYPGLSEREVERLVFDEGARRVVRSLSRHEVAELDDIARAEPSLTTALVAGLGLSRDSLRFVLAGFGRLALMRGDGSAKGRTRHILSYLSQGMQCLGSLQSMSRALRFTQERLYALLVVWSSMVAFRRPWSRPHARFMTVLMALYFHDLVRTGLDEVELLKA